MSTFAPEPTGPLTAAEFFSAARAVAPEAPTFVIDAAFASLSKYELPMTAPSWVANRVVTSLRNAGWHGPVNP